MDQPEMILKSLGLTDYETRAYITLVRLGLATAEQISESGSIPLPRVYDTLAELQKKGFVLIGKTRPKKFKPIDPEKALITFMDVQKSNYLDKLQKLKLNIPQLIKSLSVLEKTATSDSEWNIWHTEKRANVVKTLQEQENSAKKEILIFAGDMSWFSESEEIFRKVVKRGVSVRILMNIARSKSTENIIRRARKIGLDIKDSYTGSLRGQIVDNKVASIAITSRYTKELSENENFLDVIKRYELVIFENPAIISSFRENFEFWWNKLR